MENNRYPFLILKSLTIVCMFENTQSSLIHVAGTDVCVPTDRQRGISKLVATVRNILKASRNVKRGRKRRQCKLRFDRMDRGARIAGSVVG